MTGPPLRVVFAPDSFGGALDAVAVTEALVEGWQRARPGDELVRAPMADGGEGTLAAVAAALGHRAQRRSVTTTDALGRPVQAPWLLLDAGGTAVVELAAASGLWRLTPDERTPDTVRRAFSAGTGVMIRDAMDAGVQRVWLGLGGSATNDGGAGLLVALGVRFLDAQGNDLPPGGAALAGLARIEASGLDPRLASIELVIATDVTNPLCGPQGASAVYGPQKGADPATVRELDDALAVFGEALERATGRRVATAAGAGAAGGAAAGLLAFTSAAIRPGVDVVAELIGLDERLAGTQLLVTGEGRADEQTLAGKAAMGVAQRAQARGIPVVLLCGGLGPGADRLLSSGLFDLVQPIADGPLSLAEAMADTPRLVRDAADRLARSISLGQRVGAGR